MSALSGITVSADLASRFADAVQENKTRFIKVSIQNGLLLRCRCPRRATHALALESLVHDLSLPMQCLLHEDLAQLQSDDVLQPDTPAYILAKADLPSPDWISFNYVPDNAKIREKA
jgi:twinfilin-like protein